MRFKEWLLNEAGPVGAAGGMRNLDWSDTALYPTNAYDGSDMLGYPYDTRFLQVRWGVEKKHGRKLHNIDFPEYEKKKFTAVYSNTMPDTKPGFWKHSDKERPNLTIDTNADLKIQATRKSADVASVIWAHKDPNIDNEKLLNKLFGKFKPKDHQLSDDFDKPWTKKYEK